MEACNKYKRQYTELQQRLTLADQKFVELEERYMKAVTSEKDVERNLASLQNAFDQERNSRNQESEHSAELNGQSSK